MKKILGFSAIICIALGFASCKQDVELLFDESAAERLNSASDLYSAKLMASPNGWAMQLYPTQEEEAPYGSGYLVLLRFNADRSVTASMQNPLTDNQYKEDTSAWEVITDNGPVLSFNTYNEVIHKFSDPDGYDTGTAVGQNHGDGTGIGGDYEYIIVDAPDDASYLMLKGKKRATYNKMTPVEEGVNYAEYLSDVRRFHSEKFPAAVRNAPSRTGEDSVEVYNPSDIFYAGDEKYSFEEVNGGVPQIYPYNGDKITEAFTNPFLITKRGQDYYLRFRDEMTFNEVKVQDFKYVADKDVFMSVDNESFYIAGGIPADQMRRSLNNSRTWTLDAKSAMSDQFAKMYSEMAQTFQSFGWSLNKVAINAENGRLAVTLNMVKGGSSASRPYYFNMKWEDGALGLTYKSCTEDAKTLYDAYPSVKKFIDWFGRSLTFSAQGSAFNLSKVNVVGSAEEYFTAVLEKEYNK